MWVRVVVEVSGQVEWAKARAKELQAERKEQKEDSRAGILSLIRKGHRRWTGNRMLYLYLVNANPDWQIETSQEKIIYWFKKLFYKKIYQKIIKTDKPSQIY